MDTDQNVPSAGGMGVGGDGGGCGGKKWWPTETWVVNTQQGTDGVL